MHSNSFAAERTGAHADWMFLMQWASVYTCVFIHGYILLHCFGAYNLKDTF